DCGWRGQMLRRRPTRGRKRLETQTGDLPYQGGARPPSYGSLGRLFEGAELAHTSFTPPRGRSNRRNLADLAPKGGKAPHRHGAALADGSFKPVISLSREISGNLPARSPVQD